ncbi:hypothetical protein P5704_028295 (plasmid) [Pseudomonas sp. FeN3W]|nr:hypothetical protein P5704_028295 [Pseudomonas sp. FeN3W]
MTDLKALVLDVFHKVKRGDRESWHPQWLSALADHGADAVDAACKSVDPKRSVFDHSVQPDELGLFGLPLLINRFRFCSTAYGHEVHDPESVISEEDLEACRNAYDDALLYEEAVVVDKQTGQGGILVIQRLESYVTPSGHEAQKLLGDRFGAQAMCLANPANTCLAEGQRVAESVDLVVFIEGFARLSEVASIAEAAAELSERWTRRGQSTLKHNVLADHRPSP